MEEEYSYSLGSVLTLFTQAIKCGPSPSQNISSCDYTAANQYKAAWRQAVPSKYGETL